MFPCRLHLISMTAISTQPFQHDGGSQVWPHSNGISSTSLLIPSLGNCATSLRSFMTSRLMLPSQIAASAVVRRLIKRVVHPGLFIASPPSPRVVVILLPSALRYPQIPHPSVVFVIAA